MAFQVSPGVNVSEIDLTTVVPAVSSSTGVIAGVFRWGPVNTRELVGSELELTSKFSTPTNINPETFFTAANFLSYGSSLYVSRAANTSGIGVYKASTTDTGNAEVVVASTTDLSVGMKVLGMTNVPDGSIISAIDTANSTVTFSGVTPSAVETSTNAYFYSSNAALSAIASSNSSNLIAVANFASFTVRNSDHYDTMTFSNNELYYVAKYPGELGNSLKISVCDSVNAYNSNVSLDSNNVNVAFGVLTANVGSSVLTVTVTAHANGTAGEANTSANTILQSFRINDLIEVGNSSIGKQYLKITGRPTVMGTNSQFVVNSTVRRFFVNVDSNYTLADNFTITGNSTVGVPRYWEYYNLFDGAPGISTYQSSFGNSAAVDEIHVVVVDEDGKITGTPGTNLEVYKGLSRASDAKTSDGATNYYKNVINDSSQYIWWANHRTSADANTSNYSNTASNLSSINNVKPLYASFHNGQDGDGESDIQVGRILQAYDLYSSPEVVDVSLIMTGKSRGGTNGEQISNYLVDNIAEVRKDCIVLTSPERADVVNNSGQDEAQDIVTFRNSLRSSSYLIIDSGYKYQYDKYNDVFRYIPLNGDIAGLCARTDAQRDPWFSPAGFNRGQIKNLVKLAFNPTQSDRDLLYRNGVNPVATIPGQGTVLYGDKTALARPSAFDRINVRRLFIVLEKAIATAAKSSLFEFNDEFTRASFVSLVEPFLRDVQGRRGIVDFRVVCDETNNTAGVVDRNEFVGDIYIKPAKSINFIQLNFVAVRSGVSFDEIVGRF